MVPSFHPLNHLIHDFLRALLMCRVSAKISTLKDQPFIWHQIPGGTCKTEANGQVSFVSELIKLVTGLRQLNWRGILEDSRSSSREMPLGYFSRIGDLGIEPPFGTYCIRDQGTYPTTPTHLMLSPAHSQGYQF